MEVGEKTSPTRGRPPQTLWQKHYGRCNRPEMLTCGTRNGLHLSGPWMKCHCLACEGWAPALATAGGHSSVDFLQVQSHVKSTGFGECKIPGNTKFALYAICIDLMCMVLSNSLTRHCPIHFYWSSTSIWRWSPKFFSHGEWQRTPASHSLFFCAKVIYLLFLVALYYVQLGSWSLWWDEFPDNWALWGAWVLMVPFFFAWSNLIFVSGLQSTKKALSSWESPFEQEQIWNDSCSRTIARSNPTMFQHTDPTPSMNSFRFSSCVLYPNLWAVVSRQMKQF